jgi:cbb3-type cytochrome oxidase subunit 3
MTDRAKYLLESIEGLNWLTIIPMLFFFFMFIAIVYVTYSKRKSFNDYMSNLPLNDSDRSVD